MRMFQKNIVGSSGLILKGSESFMITKFSDEECKAIDEKLENPAKIVNCPRCSKKLIYIKRGNSCEVKCETENCLCDAIRGL